MEEGQPGKLEVRKEPQRMMKDMKKRSQTSYGRDFDQGTINIRRFSMIKRNPTVNDDGSRSNTIKRIQMVNGDIDLSENLGNILKPSMPDFGYQDILTFEEQHPEKTHKGWGRFLDVINKFPKQQKVQNLIDQLKEEKDGKVKKKRRRRRKKQNTINRERKRDWRVSLGRERGGMVSGFWILEIGGV